MNMKSLFVLIVISISFSIANASTVNPTLMAATDNDGDGYVASEDCDDNNAALNEVCPLEVYKTCTNDGRFDNQCLPVVTDVEGMLGNLANLAMDPDRFRWNAFKDGSGNTITPSRPTDDPFAYMAWSDFWNFFGSIITNPRKVLKKAEDIFFDVFEFGGWNFWPPTKYLHSFQMAKKHLQSIQYIDNGPNGDKPPTRRFLVTSISDETEHNLTPVDKAAIQLVWTGNFASEEPHEDRVMAQRLLNADDKVARYNHPGGSQLIGEYLFLALENFGDPNTPAQAPEGENADYYHWPSTGVWKIDRKNEQIDYLYSVLTRPEGEVKTTDRHQSTAAVTRLSDQTFLLAACVYKKCDYINFYKSDGITLATDPSFYFIGQWKRPKKDASNKDWWKDAWATEPPEDNWSDCGPQNMNFAADSDGGIYLVLFGGEAGFIGCDTLIGFKDTLYGYKVDIDFSREAGNLQYAILFTHINNVRVIPGRFRNTKYYWKDLRSAVWMPNFHGLNLMAGSGLWLGPNGRNTIAFLATEHYDSDRSYKRPVNANSRWAVSSNWDHQPLIWADTYRVEVDEGDMATNAGGYADADGITLSATIGTILDESAGAWSWSWLTRDGPDDTQMLTLTRSDKSGASDSANFDLIVNNVPPTADAGPDKVVECVYGEHVPLDASGSTDPGDDTLTFLWAFSDVPGSSAPPLDPPNVAKTSFLPNALGTYLAMVTVTDDDNASDTDDVVILFEDTTPPVISSVSATPDVLWSPNNKLVPVDVSVLAVDACDVNPVCAITSIESNEPGDDAGDSNIISDFTADLRAERLGAGSGRIYTISVQCSDYAGNSTIGTTTVTVPHDQKRVIR